MRDLLPKSEAVKRAVRWISDQLNSDPAARISKLIEEASINFDLTPKESMFLYDFYCSVQNQKIPKNGSKN